jgi:hypothetical protein
MNILNDLQQEWNNMKDWVKIVIGIMIILTVIVLILAFFNIIKPAYVLWAILVIFVLIVWMHGKKGLKFG